MKARRKARSVALQALYEIDCTGHEPGEVITNRLAEEEVPDGVIPFIHNLVNGVLEHRDWLDGLIERYAPEWPLEQMAIIDRNILRMALYEFLVDGETPVKVAINEAVELAKLFGSESTFRFVNGVLGAIVSQREAIGIAYRDHDEGTA